MERDATEKIEWRELDADIARRQTDADGRTGDAARQRETERWKREEKKAKALIQSMGGHRDRQIDRQSVNIGKEHASISSIKGQMMGPPRSERTPTLRTEGGFLS